MRNSRIVAIASCILALALGSTSCKKDKDGHTPGELMTIGATIVQANGDGTKTFLAPNPNDGKVDVYWSTGDKIKLFGAGDTQGKEFTLKEDGSAGTASGTFEGTAPAPFPPYYAAYPASASFDGGSTFTFSIPDEISGVAAPSASSSNYSFIQKSTIPMVGVSAHGEDLQFYNAMSSIFLALKGTDKVSKIVLEDLDPSNPPLSGTLTVKQKDNGYGIDFAQTSIAEGGHTLTLTANVLLNESKYSLFCFPVPIGAFAGPESVSIKVYDDNGEIANYAETISGGVGENTAYALVKTITSSTVLTASLNKPDGSNWSTGDQIKVYGQEQSDGEVFTATAGTDNVTFTGKPVTGGSPYYAVYPQNSRSFTYDSGTATITFEVSPVPSKSAASVPMVGYSANGSTMTFHNALSPVNIKLKGSAKVKKIVIIDKDGAAFGNTLTVTIDADGNISRTMSGSSSSTLTYENSSGVQLSSDNYSTFCFLMLTTSNRNLKIKVYDVNDILTKVDERTISGNTEPQAVNVELAKINKMYTLPHPFSVSSEKQVYFSRGNLWYNDSDKSFHFETHQWDADTKNWTDANNAHHLGHFYWSDNVTNAVAKNHPNSITSTIFTNNSDTEPSSSFTVEGVTGKFYILQQYDRQPYWEYLVGNERTSTIGISGKKLWGMGTVNGVKGLILLPDNWNVENYSTFSYATRKCSSNVYSGDTWENMEYDGAVFMPIAGVGYEGDGTISDPDEGAYWPSHYNSGKLDEFYFIDNNSSYDPKAYYLDEDESLVYWCSIRLVSDTQQ